MADSPFQSKITHNPDTIRFHTPDELEKYLKDTKLNIVFSAIPTSGEPETFRYVCEENAVIASDGTLFDSVDDFICYAFQGDAEGYPRAEYVDLMLKVT
jgi:hypothetical protein